MFDKLTSETAGIIYAVLGLAAIGLFLSRSRNASELAQSGAGALAMLINAAAGYNGSASSYNYNQG